MFIAEFKFVDVNVFVIGVEDVDEGALKEIVSESFNMYVFNLENFILFYDIVGNLVFCVYLFVILGRVGDIGIFKDIIGNGDFVKLLFVLLFFGDEFGNCWY